MPKDREEHTLPEDRQHINYFTTKTFDKALQTAFLSGGQSRKKHDKVKVVLGSLRDPDPFATLAVTDHGENRIKSCVKYELGDGWRLVTYQSDSACTFLFVGDHEDTDRWLDSHKGEAIGVRDRHLVRVPGTGESPMLRQVLTDHHFKPLIDMLDTEGSDHLLRELPASLVRKFGTLHGGSTHLELNELVHAVADPQRAELLRTVFVLLLEGNVDGAQAHVDLSLGRIAPVEQIDAKDFVQVMDGAEVRQLRVGSAEYEAWLNAFERRTSWHDWFLFLHPEQEKVVNADYPAVAQLSGVSGSGKTCVAVRRAMRLAKPAEARVLLLTLNRSLAGLLRQLVDAACLDERLRTRIEVTSFFELARRLLSSFEPQNARHYVDVTWKLDEHVDEVFREYYRCWANNLDATVLLPLHKSLNARGVSGEKYVREEFDWVRSAVDPQSRAQYLNLERAGRKFPIGVDWRHNLLKGLDGWEQKMRAVGVVDYLGLTSALAPHIDKIAPKYTNVLVDEAQDFGTTELRIIRRLAHPGPNDLFLCGDVAQTVLPKHRSLKDAKIDAGTRERITQNYRNSREILISAYELLIRNMGHEAFDPGDLEILNPRCANFSGPVPIALAADTLEQEIAYARTYASTRRDAGARAICLAFAGFSSRDVSEFAKRCKVTALEGAYDPSADWLVFSDLEQTKGYEFDTLIIVNCCAGMLPARDALPEEGFRDICKLYVAMTRARRELILSFHGSASPWIVTVNDTITTEEWSSIEHLHPDLLLGEPVFLPEIDPNIRVRGPLALSGRQFIYTSEALGLSVDTQDKVEELVDGRGLQAAFTGRRLKWPDMATLMSDLHRSRRRYENQIGAKAVEELCARLPLSG
jgi:hypothetical protein